MMEDVMEIESISCINPRNRGFASGIAEKLATTGRLCSECSAVCCELSDPQLVDSRRSARGRPSFGSRRDRRGWQVARCRRIVRRAAVECVWSWPSARKISGIRRKDGSMGSTETHQKWPSSVVMKISMGVRSHVYEKFVSWSQNCIGTQKKQMGDSVLISTLLIFRAIMFRKQLSFDSSIMT
jgi:hypothetical protein